MPLMATKSALTFFSTNGDLLSVRVSCVIGASDSIKPGSRAAAATVFPSSSTGPTAFRLIVIREASRARRHRLVINQHEGGLLNCEFIWIVGIGVFKCASRSGMRGGGEAVWRLKLRSPL
jgi:hypothetical protein